MGKIETVEREIERFSAEELASFRSWFAEFDASQWDHKLNAMWQREGSISLPMKHCLICAQATRAL